jgi:hypothetical protein
MLTWRTFKQSKGHIMNKYDFVQCILVALIAGTVFFQIDLSFRTLRDEMGVVSFLAVCVSQFLGCFLISVLRTTVCHTIHFR